MTNFTAAADTPAKLATTVAQAIENFPRLPDEAEVPARVFATLASVTETTIWRWAAAGKVDAPINRGRNVSRWKVGSIRKFLANA